MSSSASNNDSTSAAAASAPVGGEPLPSAAPAPLSGSGSGARESSIYLKRGASIPRIALEEEADRAAETADSSSQQQPPADASATLPTSADKEGGQLSDAMADLQQTWASPK